METPQLLQGRALEYKDGVRAADMNDTESRTSSTQDPSSGSPVRSTASRSSPNGADSWDNEGKADDIEEVAGGGSGSGQKGNIAKLGWADSSGSSNDEACSYLGDDDNSDQEESRSRNIGVTQGADSHDEVEGAVIIGHVATGGGGDGGQKGYIVKLGWSDSSGSSNDEACSYLGNHTDGDKESGSRNNGVTHGADSRYDEVEGDVIIGHVATGGGGGGGQKGYIVKLGWSESSGSSNDEAQQSADSELGDRAELHHECLDESSSSVESIKPKATNSVEPFTPDSHDQDSTPNSIELEKDHLDKVEPLPANSEDSSIPTGPKKNALPADNNQDRGSNYIEPGSENAEQDMETPAAVGAKTGEVSSGPIEPENAQQGAETPAVDMPSLADHDAELDEGQDVHEGALVADRREAGSDRDRQMIARLFEYESGHRVDAVGAIDEVVEVAVGKVHEGAIGEIHKGGVGQGNAGEGRQSGGVQSWWVWLWQVFLVTVIVSVYATTIWSAWVSSTSVSSSSPPTIITTTTTAGVRTHTASKPFLLTMKDALVERTGLLSFNLSPTWRSGPGGDSDNLTERSKNAHGHATSTKARVSKKESARNKNEKKNDNSDKKNASTNEINKNRRNKNSETKKADESNNNNSISRQERWAARWAAWAAEFEELVDGPLV